jgi:hypothetical protein
MGIPAAMRSNMIMLGCTVSVLGAFTGLTTTTYAYTVLRHKQLRFYYNLYLALGGCSIGGSAIWTMHCTRVRSRSIAARARPFAGGRILLI